MIVKGCDKIGGSLIDAEIAGQRTMISYRPDLTVKKMVFRTEGVELNNIQVAPLEGCRPGDVRVGSGSDGLLTLP